MTGLSELIKLIKAVLKESRVEDVQISFSNLLYIAECTLEFKGKPVIFRVRLLRNTPSNLGSNYTGTFQGSYFSRCR